MKLGTYLSKRKITDEQFGKLVGLSQSQVSRLKRGVSSPLWKTVIAIEKATNGKVSAKDFFVMAEEKAEAEGSTA
jgi:transcriptional regulator with XRE-family HTH domain